MKEIKPALRELIIIQYNNNFAKIKKDLFNYFYQ